MKTASLNVTGMIRGDAELEISRVINEILQRLSDLEKEKSDHATAKTLKTSDKSYLKD